MSPGHSHTRKWAHYSVSVSAPETQELSCQVVRIRTTSCEANRIRASKGSREDLRPNFLSGTNASNPAISAQDMKLNFSLARRVAPGFRGSLLAGVAKLPRTKKKLNLVSAMGASNTRCCRSRHQEAAIHSQWVEMVPDSIQAFGLSFTGGAIFRFFFLVFFCVHPPLHSFQVVDGSRMVDGSSSKKYGVLLIAQRTVGGIIDATGKPATLCPALQACGVHWDLTLLWWERHPVHPFASQAVVAMQEVS